ncbi:SDR family oxidoreductase [Mucilaginibacter paludis]|uniref:Short-chain dehydrogenase/reductase SDR n=1 Tax=Mucilaginibacter paludis DSM 18603 TaxID=714943 RepID=H1Y992_9SPHI|nr:SDR family NAD(P)-dependent oxidoreductase [Mucilaginibacter paludis]EHQ29470.1 short-chain dehydrogenase/reductase SDR [Mucilaginibacter paludis DSM 18603]
MELKNSTILITGGSSGIGLEFVKQLIAQGPAAILITGRDMSRLEQVRQQYPQIHIFQSDVSDPEAIKQLAETVTAQFPALNIIINNAGIMRNINLLDTGQRDITAEIAIDLSGPILMVQQFLPHLLTQPAAAIINVSSGLAFVPFPISPVYSAAKAGLRAYTRVLRLQLKATKIKVFELAPPSTETPLQKEFTGLVDSNQNMAANKMIVIAIKGILNDQLEIKPGLSKVLKLMSRLMPEFFLNFLDKTLQKARSKNLHS